MIFTILTILDLCIYNHVFLEGAAHSTSFSEHVYEIETDSQTWRTDFWLQGVGWGGWVGSLGLAYIQTIIYMMDKQQGPIIEPRELNSTS